jgi:hypothetical protein
MQELSSVSQRFVTEEAKPLTELFAELRGAQSLLFPSDMLLGASPESQYRLWIEHQLKPRLRDAGEEGKLWWRAITELDLAADPELLWRVTSVLTMWFFPDFHDYLRFAETVALLIVIRKLAKGEDLGE